MSKVIADCIANDQICYKCSYLSTCKEIQRKGMAKPYQYENSPHIKDKIFEELAV